MKVTKILIAMLASAFIVTACDPIEDEDLRDKYVTDAGTPITKEALQAANIHYPTLPQPRRSSGRRPVYSPEKLPPGHWRFMAHRMGGRRK